MTDRVVMHCPHCKRQHLDGRWWKHRPHITHTCRFCGLKWDSERPLIGVGIDEAGDTLALDAPPEGEG